MGGRIAEYFVKIYELSLYILPKYSKTVHSRNNVLRKLMQKVCEICIL